MTETIEPSPDVPEVPATPETLPAPRRGPSPPRCARGVGKSFGSVIALRDITLHVDPGTVTCVLGDNGAGKSTLIKVLSGVHQPTEGELLVAGEAVPSPRRGTRSAPGSRRSSRTSRPCR